MLHPAFPAAAAACRPPGASPTEPTEDVVLHKLRLCADAGLLQVGSLPATDELHGRLALHRLYAMYMFAVDVFWTSRRVREVHTSRCVRSAVKAGGRHPQYRKTACCQDHTLPCLWQAAAMQDEDRSWLIMHFAAFVLEDFYAK